MSLPPWSERIKNTSGPEPLNMYDYTSNVPLNNTDPTDTIGRIYGSPSGENVRPYRPLGRLVEMEGKYGSGDWRSVLFQNAR